MIPATVKCPSECSEAELSAFCALIRQGGEVAEGGLERRIQCAKALAFVSDADVVIGVAAIKNPISAYRSRVFTCAQVDDNPEEYPYELGWFFVCESYRGKRLSSSLAKALLDKIEGGIYATSSTSNKPMHKTLICSGFSKAGQPYNSKENPNENLTFFLRPQK